MNDVLWVSDAMLLESKMERYSESIDLFLSYCLSMYCFVLILEYIILGSVLSGCIVRVLASCVNPGKETVNFTGMNEMNKAAFFL